MRKDKDKPLDRYPYMENDLKNRENQFVRVETYATGFRYLENRIDNIEVGTDFVKYDEFNTYKEATNETLASLQEQIDAIDTSAYVEKSTYNTDKAEIDASIEDHEERITTLEANSATKTELNNAVDNLQEQIVTKLNQTDFDEFSELVNESLNTLEDFADDVPNTYATKTELSECCEEVDGRIDTLETTVEAIPNTYATKTELSEYETSTDATLNNLQEQIDGIDLSDFITTDELGDVLVDYVEKSTYNTDKAQTDETLESLQNQIDQIDTSAYVEKTTYNTDKTETDETLESLQNQIDQIDTSAYVEKTTYNTDKAETDGRIDALETIAEGIPTTYATKTELAEYETTTDGRIDALETIAEGIPTTYATKTELTEYETTTDAALDAIREEIENLDNYDPATDTVLGVVKTNSTKGITLNEDDQLEVNGRMGQTEEGGLYYPPTLEVERVGPTSLMMTEATGNAANSSRIFALAGGATITLKVTAQPGATRFEVSNTFSNRFICAACRGGILAVDERSARIKTVKILNVYLANDAEMTPLIPYSGANESRNNIIIETEEPLSDTDSLTKIRGYGFMRSDSSVYIGQGVGNGEGTGAVGKNLLLGQAILSIAANNIVTGNGHYVGKNRCAIFGANHIINTSGTLAGGLGHDTTNGSDYVVPLGCYSLVDEDTVLAIGDGTSNVARHNVFEVRKDGSIIIADRNITQELTEATNSISTLGTQISEVEGNITGLRTDLNSLTTRVDGINLNDHIGYKQWVFNSTKNADVIFNSSFFQYEVPSGYITYCNGMLCFNFSFNTIVERPTPGSNVTNMGILNTNFRPYPLSSSGTYSSSSTYFNERGIVDVNSGGAIQIKNQTPIKVGASPYFQFSFPCSASFATINNLLQD